MRIVRGQLAAVVAPQQSRQGEGGQQQRLQRHAFQCAQHGHLAHQAVEAEGQRNQQCQPGHVAGLHRHPQHAAGGQCKGQPLGLARAFVQKDKAQRHVDERQDEVAQARVQHVAVVHRPDVGEPVACQQQGRDHELAQQRGAAPHLAQPGKAAQGGQHDEHEHQRPHHAVQHHLQRRRGLQLLEEQGEQPPQEIGRQAVENAAGHGWLGRQKKTERLGGTDRRAGMPAGERKTVSHGMVRADLHQLLYF